MPRLEKTQAPCPQCGHSHSAELDRCPVCGVQTGAPTESTPEQSDGPRAIVRLKTQWVAAVGAFWTSMLVLVAVFFLQDRVSLVLVSICLGLMILGIGLKIRYQRQLRKEPARS